MVAQPQLPRRMSLEEFLALPGDENLHELVRGEVRIMPPPRGKHGRIEAAFIAALDHYLDDKARALGWVPEHGLDTRDRLVGFVAGGEFGLRFSLPDDPHQVRGADGPMAFMCPPNSTRLWRGMSETTFPRCPVS